MKHRTIAGEFVDTANGERPSDEALLRAKGELIRSTNHGAVVFDLNSIDEWEFPDGSRLAVSQGFLMADPHWKGVT